MAYNATPAVIQASGRSRGRSSTKKTRVSICSSVTAFPPRRAGTAVALPVARVMKNAAVATISRARTAMTSYQVNLPDTQTTANATATKSLSAIGSRTAPMREPPNRRGTQPSPRSVAAGRAGTRSRTGVLVTMGNRIASGIRTSVMPSAGEKWLGRAAVELGAAMAPKLLDHGSGNDAFGSQCRIERLRRKRVDLSCGNLPIRRSGVVQFAQAAAEQPGIRNFTGQRSRGLARHFRVPGEHGAGAR